MDYLLKASAILVIFYLFYKVVLNRETFFQSNRIYLLGGIIASLTLPLIVIPIYVEQIISPIQNFTITQASDIVEIPKTINWTQIIGTGYIAGVIFFGAKFILSLFSLAKLFISNKKEKIGDYYYIKSVNNDSPFSFFNYIVYNPNTFEQKELQQILMHEKVHAHQWHSFDVLFSQLVTIAFWFNPISWFYKKELQQNLEFIADSVSQKKSTCQKSYQHLLLKTSIAPNQFALTNNFYNSLIKKRIIMLHKNRSKNTNQLKFVFILPLLMAFVFTFNTKIIAQNVVKKVTTKDDNRGLVLVEVEEDVQMVIITKDSKKSDLDNIKESFSKEGVTIKFKGIKRNGSGEITAIKIDVSSKQSNANFNTSSDQPIKPIKISFDEKGDHISIGNGGVHQGYGDLHFISKDGNHKIQSSGKGHQNYVFVSDDGKHEEHQLIEIKVDGNNEKHEVIEIKGDGDGVFVIKKDAHGNLHKGEEMIFISEDGNKKVVEVIVKGDDKNIWATKEGNTTIDIIKSDGNSNNMVFISGDDDASLVYIDGKESSKEAMKKIDANKIEKIEILKGEDAIKKYGVKAKDGVILVTTKKE